MPFGGNNNRLISGNRTVLVTLNAIGDILKGDGILASCKQLTLVIVQQYDNIFKSSCHTGLLPSTVAIGAYVVPWWCEAKHMAVRLLRNARTITCFRTHLRNSTLRNTTD